MNAEDSLRLLHAHAADLDPAEAEEVRRLLGGWDGPLRHAREGLLAFTRYTFPGYRVNWHHRLICDALDAFARGRLKRLMVFCPPRTGKSELVSRRLPAFLLGRDPDAQVMACTHSASLAADMNRDVQRVIDSDAYRRLFPGTQLSGKDCRTPAPGTWVRNSDAFEVVGRRGVYRSAGVGAGIAGKGFDFGVVDDPIPGQEEADSAAFREKLWAWYTSDFFTRRADDDAGILVTVTRWRTDDLPGRLLEQAAADPSLPRWTVLRFPALAEEGDECHPGDPRAAGEALWPERFPERSLGETRRASPPRTWAAVHQQRPVLKEGAMFRREWLSRLVPAAPADAQRVRYWDKGYSARGDYSCGALLAKDAWGRYYVEDVVRGRWSPHERNEVIKAAADGDCRRYGGRVRIRVEQPPGAGKETTDTLVAALAGHPVKAEKPSRAKEERAEPFADQCEAGNVFLVAATWNRDFVEELLTFPFGANDDQVDAAAGAFHALAVPPPGQAVAAGARGPVTPPGGMAAAGWARAPEAGFWPGGY